jgi:hypothetical protein
METDNVQMKLYLELRNVHPVDYLKELRLALLDLLKRHFEGPPEELSESEQFAFYRLTDFLIRIHDGALIPTTYLCGGEQ